MLSRTTKQGADEPKTLAMQEREASSRLVPAQQALEGLHKGCAEAQKQG